MVGFSPSEEPSARQADINIFTVASGLLYEVSLPQDHRDYSDAHEVVAFCIHHDTQCYEEHQFVCQILVHCMFVLLEDVGIS